jgi:hypothetical protein
MLDPDYNSPGGDKLAGERALMSNHRPICFAVRVSAERDARRCLIHAPSWVDPISPGAGAMSSQSNDFPTDVCTGDAMGV